MGYPWGSIIQEKRYENVENMQSEITILVSKLVSTFAHETREIAHETSFFGCSRNECSRNEFFFAHETSAHETSLNSLENQGQRTGLILIFLLWKRGRFYWRFLIFFSTLTAFSCHSKKYPICLVPCAVEKNLEAISYLFFDLWFEVFTIIL